MTPSSRPLALGLAAGVVADWLVGDPGRGHPVAGFGRVAAALEARMWRPSRVAGAAHTLLLVGGTAGAAAWADRRLRRRPGGRAVLLGAVTWAAVGGRLATVGRDSARPCGPGPGSARTLAPSLVGRDPQPDGHSCAGRRSSRWPRTPPTRSSGRSCGAPWPARPGWSATGPRTPWTPWSATRAPGTCASAGPRPGSTTCSAGRVRGWGGAGLPARPGGGRRRGPGLADRAGRRRRPPEPQRRPHGGRLRRCLRRPPGRPQRLRRPGRGPPHARRRFAAGP